MPDAGLAIDIIEIQDDALISIAWCEIKLFVLL